MKAIKKNNASVLRAWAFYDWANSVYSLVVTSSIFPLFYGALFRLEGKQSWGVLGLNLPSESIISYVTALAFVLISILSPILSGVADHLGNKKFFMKFFCYLGAVSCGLLYFFNLQDFYISLFIYLLALLGFWGSLVFYNSYLPDIATPDIHDKISARGFSLGYIGSVILLVALLFSIMNYKWLSFENELEAMRCSFVLVGLWWVGFSQISYAKLPSLRNQNRATKNMFSKGLKELKKVYQIVCSQKEIKAYLTSFFVYSMAVQTILIIAAYFGEKEINWETSDQRTIGLIISILLIQLIAIIGAVSAARLSHKFGSYKILIAINVLWICICIWAFFVSEPIDFYITATFFGLVMGGIQSLSRSTFSKLISNQKDTTSFFSFYDVTEKIGIVIGMLIYGGITQLTGEVRYAMLCMVVFFILGIYFLIKTFKASKNLR